MDTIQISSFILLGLTAAILQFKRFYRFLAFLHLLFFLAAGLVVSSGLDDAGQDFLFGLIAVTSINFVAANLIPAMLRRRVIRLIIPVITFAVFFFISRGHDVEALETKFSIYSYILIAGVAVSLLTVDVGELKIRAFNKLLGGMSDEKILSAFVIFAAAISLFLGIFSGLTFGAYAVTAAYLSASFYRQDDDKYPVVSMLLITLMLSLAYQYGISDLSILKPKLIAGLLIGLFGFEFIRLLIRSKDRTLGAVITSYLVVGLLVGTLLFVGTKLSSLGGIDAVLALVMGIAIANLINGKAFVALGIGSLLMAGIGFIPDNTDSTQDKIEAEAETSNQMTEAKVKYTTLDDAVGMYEIIPGSSRVDFKLGPNKETEGAFKKVRGTIEIKEELKKSNFDIKLSLADFTTYDDFRDESLMEETYFNASQFPGMTYKSERIEIDGDEYTINGMFTMLGVKRLVKVSLKRIDTEGKVILIGEGSLDRTEFGMDPSAAEGNVVDFTYKVELKKLD